MIRALVPQIDMSPYNGSTAYFLHFVAVKMLQV